MGKFISSLKDASEKLGVTFDENLYQVEKEYPFLISEYYLNLIDKKYPLSDPIFVQSFPSVGEINITDKTLTDDPQCEKDFVPVPRLVHRYNDRALILATNRCSTFCRFCFRKRYWKADSKREDISTKELNRILSYLKEMKSLEEVIISGGDPLMLSDAKLKLILDSIHSIPHIKTIRLASRIPVTFPERITDKLVKLLSKYDNLWFVTHFNHPNELTKNSLDACRKITSSGIPMLNQTVLLKGINDSPETLRELFRELAANRIKPYYLFHVDPVCGVTHFATGIEKGLEIMRYFRKNLSTLATPQFAIDLPEGGGKVSLQPDYSSGDKSFSSVEETTKIDYY
ncbi:MAG: KamA family radical SAM protein [Lentisphaerota bacterium]